MTGRTDSNRRLAAGALLGTGVLHLALVPEYLGEKAYIGVLFLLGGIAATLLGARLWTRRDAAALVVGILTATAMALGFVLSRTTGLPGFHPADWEVSGLLSLVLEGAVVAAAFAALRPAGRTAVAR